MAVEVLNPLCHPRHEVASIVISRQVANQIGNKLQIIVTLIELNHREKAIRAVQELAKFLNRHVETEENNSNS